MADVGREPRGPVDRAATLHCAAPRRAAPRRIPANVEGRERLLRRGLAAAEFHGRPHRAGAHPGEVVLHPRPRAIRLGIRLRIDPLCEVVATLRHRGPPTAGAERAVGNPLAGETRSRGHFGRDHVVPRPRIQHAIRDRQRARRSPGGGIAPSSTAPAPTPRATCGARRIGDHMRRRSSSGDRPFGASVPHPPPGCGSRPSNCAARQREHPCPLEPTAVGAPPVSDGGERGRMP